MAVMSDETTRKSHPFRRIFSGVDGDVLWVLGSSRWSRTASEIARLTGRSKSQVQTVLERLRSVKLVDRTVFDGWSWNCLNDDHPFAHHIRQMTSCEFNDESVTIPKQAKAPNYWSVE